MIRVMIAEDELPLLRGLKDMIENLNPQFSVVASVKNGREAIDYLKENHVDVIFTDINMPIIDGIGILKYVSENVKEIQTVVISGYNEFSYAQQAIKYRAVNYLLKPVDRMDLKALLAEIEKEFMHCIYEKKQKFLAEMIAGYQGSEKEDPVLFDSIYMIYFCAGSFTTNFTEEVSPGNGYWEQNHLKEAAEQVLESEDSIFCFWGKVLNERILVIEEKDAVNISSLTDSIMEKLDLSLPVLAAYQDTSITVDMVKESIHFLRSRMQNRGIFGETMIVNQKSEKEDYVIPVSMEGALQSAIKKGQLEELKKILGELKEILKETKATQKNLEAILGTVLAMLNTKQAGGSNYEQNSLDIEVAELITYSVNLEQVFADFIILCETNFKNERSEGGRELMKQVDEYIRSHVKMPMTTKMLASKFGLVAPYLSKLFKDYKGQTPSQYIQKIRMDGAKELLLHYPNMLSKDVAETVGYDNPLYFSKTFKKNVGVYPSEYKLLHKKVYEEEH